MSSDRRAHGALNRRAFLRQSLPAAGVVASAAAGVDLLPGVAHAQRQAEYPPDIRCIDFRFVEDMMSGQRNFGDLTPPKELSPPTLVIHFFGLVAFVEKGRIGADLMRVMLPNSDEAPHRARLWALKETSSGTGSKDAGDYRYWDLKAGKGTRIRVEKEGGCKRRKGRDRCHPWEDCDFLSNLKELFPNGKLWDDDVLKLGAGGKVVTYMRLPGGGRLISGVPWSYLGNTTVWKYREKDRARDTPGADLLVRPRTLTDTVSFFRTLDKKEEPKVTLHLDKIDSESNDGRISVELTPKDNIITCAITHAMPGKDCPDGGGHAPPQDVLDHSVFYYKLFRNEGESKGPIPVFARTVYGLTYDKLLQLSAPVIRANKQLRMDERPSPSTDDGHCECASWF